MVILGYSLYFFIKKIMVLNGYPQHTGMGNVRFNPDFRIENFHFKHETSLLHLFTRPSFCVKSSYLG